jgi:hypothetical protein
VAHKPGLASGSAQCASPSPTSRELSRGTSRFTALLRPVANLNEQCEDSPLTMQMAQSLPQMLVLQIHPRPIKGLGQRRPGVLQELLRKGEPAVLVDVSRITHSDGEDARLGLIGAASWARGYPWEAIRRRGVAWRGVRGSRAGRRVTTVLVCDCSAQLSWEEGGVSSITRQEVSLHSWWSFTQHRLLSGRS